MAEASTGEPTKKTCVDEIVCPICWGEFDNPIVVSCGHSFCRKCAEGLTNEGEHWSYKTGHWDPIKRCPSCRASFSFSDVRKNYVMSQVTEVLEAKDKEIVDREQALERKEKLLDQKIQQQGVRALMSSRDEDKERRWKAEPAAARQPSLETSPTPPPSLDEMVRRHNLTLASQDRKQGWGGCLKAMLSAHELAQDTGGSSEPPACSAEATADGKGLTEFERMLIARQIRKRRAEAMEKKALRLAAERVKSAPRRRSPKRRIPRAVIKVEAKDSSSDDEDPGVPTTITNPFARSSASSSSSSSTTPQITPVDAPGHWTPLNPACQNGMTDDEKLVYQSDAVGDREFKEALDRALFNSLYEQ